MTTGSDTTNDATEEELNRPLSLVDALRAEGVRRSRMGAWNYANVGLRGQLLKFWLVSGKAKTTRAEVRDFITRSGLKRNAV